MAGRLQNIENRLIEDIEEAKKDEEQLNGENEIQKKTFIKNNAEDLAKLIKEKHTKKIQKKNIFIELIEFLTGK